LESPIGPTSPHRGKFFLPHSKGGFLEIFIFFFFVFVVLPHSEVEFLVILCTCILPEILSPEADLM
jgi:hypothetical protein